MADGPRFDWDGGNWPKCGKHGVGREEIEGIFRRLLSVTPAPQRSTAESRHLAIGVNDVGRAVLVVFTTRMKDGVDFIRPISARYMHEKERRHHEKQTAQEAS